LIAKFRFAGDWTRYRRQHDRRDCLRKFRNYSVLPMGGSHKETDGCYEAKTAERELLKHLHKAFSILLFRLF